LMKGFEIILIAHIGSLMDDKFVCQSSDNSDCSMHKHVVTSSTLFLDFR
jgi:hypothetical protein